MSEDDSDTEPTMREISLEKQLKEKDEIISKLHKALKYTSSGVDGCLCTVCFFPVTINGRDLQEFVCTSCCDYDDAALCHRCIYEHREKIAHFDREEKIVHSDSRGRIRYVEDGMGKDLCVVCLNDFFEEGFGYVESQTPDDIEKQIRKVLKMDEELDSECDCLPCSVCKKDVATNGQADDTFVCWAHVNIYDGCMSLLCSECIYTHRELIGNIRRTPKDEEEMFELLGRDECKLCLCPTEQDVQTSEEIEAEIKKVTKK